MGFWGSLADNTPIVGHIKAGYHAAKGESEAAEKALKASSRTTVVMAAGAAGVGAGPVGVVGAGVAAGAACDAALSISERQCVGVIEGVKNTVTGFSQGKVPVEPMMTTSMIVVSDGLAGASGAGVRCAAKLGVRCAAELGGNMAARTGRDIFNKATTATRMLYYEGPEAVLISAAKSAGVPTWCVSILKTQAQSYAKKTALNTGVAMAAAMGFFSGTKQLSLEQTANEK